MSVPLAALLPADSPRLEGRDEAHVARLMELDVPLPPILVDRRSMRVIDGMHRLAAAFRTGAETIFVEFFDGNAEEAFLRAVEANVTHGLPLSREDRRAAAERIIASHPAMSDRAIARATGLGAKTVASIRRQTSVSGPRLNSRIGRDGKVRPLNGAEGRRRAAELLVRYPQASLRELARLAGISPATVSDVRRRLAAGEPPVAEPHVVAGREAHDQEARDGAGAARVDAGRETYDPEAQDGAQAAEHGHARDLSSAARTAERREAGRGRPTAPDPAPLLEKLLRDPSLRHKEEGRHLLRVLRQNALGEQGWSKLAAAVPSHCEDLVVDLARRYAETWMEFARELDKRMR
ncbi:transcriptional regulator [Streptomyces griseicoloratus]|uniref:transcriptional regulator n=1 Tax=Streptomyces griseicoloratus TaxID=2752516 RepID=UPI00281151DD|nr:transcriptional regulator [Streptomyces griseicoloratus]